MSQSCGVKVCVCARDFLTGFHKRKLERRRAALEEMRSKLKEEQKRVREEVCVCVCVCVCDEEQKCVREEARMRSVF